MRSGDGSASQLDPRVLTFRAGMLKRLTQLQPYSTADPARPLEWRTSSEAFDEHVLLPPESRSCDDRLNLVPPDRELR